MPTTPANFQVGDWVTYLPEPEKEFEIITVSGEPYHSEALPSSVSVAPGCDFLLRRGGHYEGFEPFKSARSSELQPLGLPTNTEVI